MREIEFKTRGPGLSGLCTPSLFSCSPAQTGGCRRRAGCQSLMGIEWELIRSIDGYCLESGGRQTVGGESDPKCNFKKCVRLMTLCLHGDKVSV